MKIVNLMKNARPVTPEESAKASRIMESVRKLSPEQLDSFIHDMEVHMAHLMKSDKGLRAKQPDLWKEIKPLAKEFNHLGHAMDESRKLKLAA